MYIHDNKNIVQIIPFKTPNRLHDLRFFNHLIESSIKDNVTDNTSPHVKWNVSAFSLNTKLFSLSSFWADYYIKSINTTTISIANTTIEANNGPIPTIPLPFIAT